VSPILSVGRSFAVKQSEESSPNERSKYPPLGGFLMPRDEERQLSAMLTNLSPTMRADSLLDVSEHGKEGWQ